jgi:hypothetical protein
MLTYEEVVDVIVVESVSVTVSAATVVVTLTGGDAVTVIVQASGPLRSSNGWTSRTESRVRPRAPLIYSSHIEASVASGICGASLASPRSSRDHGFHEFQGFQWCQGQFQGGNTGSGQGVGYTQVGVTVTVATTCDALYLLRCHVRVSIVVVKTGGGCTVYVHGAVAAGSE